MLYAKLSRQSSHEKGVDNAGLTTVPVVPWEVPSASRGDPTNCQFFCHAVLTSVHVDNTFTNHKFHVGLHVTFDLNDNRIPIQ